jgi:hypothetical protein
MPDDSQGSDGLHDAVAGFRLAVRPAGQDGGRRLVGIDGIGLAVGPPGLAIGAVNVDDGDLVRPQEPGEFGAVGASPFAPTVSTSPCERIHSNRRRQPSGVVGNGAVARCRPMESITAAWWKSV